MSHEIYPHLSQWACSPALLRLASNVCTAQVQVEYLWANKKFFFVRGSEVLIFGYHCQMNIFGSALMKVLTCKYLHSMEFVNNNNNKKL